MSEERLDQIHNREIGDRRRSQLYQVALATAILIVLFALAMAARSILIALG